MTTNPKSTEMQTVTLSAEERTELMQLLEQSLGDTRVEVHRTHTPSFRDAVQHREVILQSLLEKLRHPHA